MARGEQLTLEREPDAPAAAEPTAAPVAVAAAPARGHGNGGGMSVAAVLALQRSAGNRAVARALRTPLIQRLVSGNYAGLFDYDQLAEQIHTAIEGLGTDEQAIFHALERLQRDGAAIAQLKTAYARYGDLEADLRDDLSGSELNYALQLINAGGAGGTETIGAAPRSDADHDSAARRLRAAVEGAGTDEEAIYAVLQPYGRNSGLVARLKEIYAALYGEDLRERLVDELTNDEFQHAAYLMGESALEQSEVTPAEAARIFTVMAGLTFTDTTGAQSPVPYHYPVDGCYARAQMMAQMLTRAGFASERVFATSTVPGSPLSIENPYSRDQPGGSPAVTQWFYHVAPIINVRQGSGVVQTVIDPSTQSGPVPIDTWLSAMSVGAGTYQRMTHAELMTHLATSPAPRYGTTGFPMGERLAWTADRNTMYPGWGPQADSRAADAELERLTPTMTGYAAMATIHEVAAAVRTELAKPGCTAADVIGVIRAAAPPARAPLWLRFPHLRAEAVGRFPADEAALDAAVAP